MMERLTVVTGIPFMLTDFLLCKVGFVNRDPFRAFAAEPCLLRNGEMHLRRVQV
jgi:hypothetical protein